MKKILPLLTIVILIVVYTFGQNNDTLKVENKRIVIFDNVNLYDRYDIVAPRSIIILRKNAIVTVLDSANKYYKVQYINPKSGSKCSGYLLKTMTIDEQSIEAYNKTQKQKDSIAKVNEIKQKEEYNLSLYQKYGIENASRIINHEIWMGMTKEMVIESIGKPNKINRTVGSWGVHEQLVYDYMYIYIENDKVTSFQDETH